MDQYTQARLSECQNETERQMVLAFIRLEEKAKQKEERGS